MKRRRTMFRPNVGQRLWAGKARRIEARLSMPMIRKEPRTARRVVYLGGKWWQSPCDDRLARCEWWWR
jgi:hypothetical protein